ncbi:MAG: hypothetical protein EXR11_00385 [Rhodospirillaceae bacterium]|nr:hypothetical protein [Rhodospirillaceae bacterium]
MSNASPRPPSRRTRWSVAARFTAFLLVTTAASAQASTYLTPVFPSGAAKASFVRLHNPTAAAGSATIALRRAGSSTVLGTWTTNVPAGASVQTALRDIEAAARVTPAAANDTYSLAVTSTFNGFAQHVVWNTSGGSLTNVSNCGPALSMDGANLASVHTGLIANYPSSIILYNTGTAARAAILTIRDSRNGQTLGTWTSPSMSAGASSREFTAVEILAAARIDTSNGVYHVNIALDGAFTGFAQHIVANINAGSTTDMSAKCNLTAGGAP